MQVKMTSNEYFSNKKIKKGLKIKVYTANLGYWVRVDSFNEYVPLDYWELK